MTTSINHQFFFPHPQESVWEYLTNADLMALWLMKTDFQPIEGRDFQFTVNPVPSLNFDGIIYCKVLEIVPFKKLSYSWKCGPGDGKITLDTVVVWELRPKDKGTELLLDHSGASTLENFNIFNAMDGGWVQNVNKIAERLNAEKNSTPVSN